MYNVLFKNIFFSWWNHIYYAFYWNLFSFLSFASVTEIKQSGVWKNRFAKENRRFYFLLHLEMEYLIVEKRAKQNCLCILQNQTIFIKFYLESIWIQKLKCLIILLCVIYNNWQILTKISNMSSLIPSLNFL